MVEPVHIAADSVDTLRSWQITNTCRVAVIDTVQVAGAARAAVIRVSEQMFATGMLPDCLHGTGRRDGIHSHAFWLSEDRDGDGFLDHLSIFAPSGFCVRSKVLLEALDQLWIDGAGTFPLLSDDRPAAWTGPSQAWLPVTPFIGPRHAWKGSTRRPKARRSAHEQLAYELSRLRTAAGRPLPAFDIHPLNSTVLPRASCFSLGTRRENIPTRAVRGWFALEFAQPVSGPLCLGYAAHFGLGRFKPFYCCGAAG